VKILLIRLRLIGDVVFTTPAIRALYEAFPGVRLTYLVERTAAPVVLGNSLLHEVIVVERRRGLARVADDVRLAARLRRARFDVAVDFHGGPRAAWLAWTSGAAVRVGYRIAGRTWMYTHVVDRPSELRPRHSVENQWDLLAALGPALARRPDRRANPVEMAEADSVSHAIDRRLDAAGVGPEAELIVIHVSAGNPFRRWPAEAFVELLVGLSFAAPNRRIILSAGPSEAAAVAGIRRTAAERLGPAGASALVPFGEIGIDELKTLVVRAALFIGGDTGPLHVAATTATPIVGIYGPTLVERSAPWRDPALVTESVQAGPLPCRPCDQRRCLPGDFRCLTWIPPAAVLAAAERALARRRAAADGAQTG
jgi:ADP-heptose:LPS heptosyltransferase